MNEDATAQKDALENLKTQENIKKDSGIVPKKSTKEHVKKDSNRCFVEKFWT